MASISKKQIRDILEKNIRTGYYEEDCDILIEIEDKHVQIICKIAEKKKVIEAAGIFIVDEKKEEFRFRFSKRRNHCILS